MALVAVLGEHGADALLEEVEIFSIRLGGSECREGGDDGNHLNPPTFSDCRRGVERAARRKQQDCWS